MTPAMSSVSRVTRAVRRGWKPAVLAVVSTVLVLAAVEVVLRAYPLLLGDIYADGVLSKYSTRPGGIFYWDRSLWMQFMIPNYTTRMYARRHGWTHQTDAYGFRNRDVHPPADVMLLGDSFVYGHGVEYEDTLGPLLAAASSRSVVNLGRQADCAYQEAYLLTEYLPVFRPRHVFYHFWENDIHDLRAYLDARAMEKFIATPVAAITWPPRTPMDAALRRREEGFRRRSWIRRFQETSYVFKAYLWARTMLAVRPAGAAPGDDDGTDASSLGWRYTIHAIRYMHHRAERGGATLVIVPIIKDRPRMRAILEEVAREHGIAILDTSRLSPRDASLWLPQDGHFSPAGARVLARLEAQYLARVPAR
jgi:hypothetical protein